MQQQFEGESLEQLVLEVKSKWGTNAKIIKAEKVRSSKFRMSGALQKYTLIVEVPDVIDLNRPIGKDRFKIDLAKHRENELVRDPAEIAKRLARAYGEVVDPDINGHDITDTHIDFNPAPKVIPSQNKDKKDHSKGPIVKQPRWPQLKRDALRGKKITKNPFTAPESTKHDDPIPQCLQAYDSPKDQNLADDAPSFQQALQDANRSNSISGPIETLNDSHDDSFDEDLLALALDQTSYPLGDLIQTPTNTNVKDNSLVNLQSRTWIDLTKGVDRAILPNESFNEKQISYHYPTLDSQNTKTNQMITDHLSLLEKRVNELTQTLADEVRSDILRAKQNPKTSNASPSQDPALRSVLVVGSNAVINEGLHYLLNTSGEIPANICDQAAILLDSKITIATMIESQQVDPSPKLMIVKTSKAVDYALNDIRYLRERVGILDTYVFVKSSGSLSATTRLIKELGGSKNLTIVVCGSPENPAKFDSLNARICYSAKASVPDDRTRPTCKG